MEPNALCSNEYNCMDFDRLVDCYCMNSNRVGCHGDLMVVVVEGMAVVAVAVVVVVVDMVGLDVLVDMGYHNLESYHMGLMVVVDDRMVVVGVVDMVVELGDKQVLAVADDMKALVVVDGKKVAVVDKKAVVVAEVVVDRKLVQVVVGDKVQGWVVVKVGWGAQVDTGSNYNSDKGFDFDRILQL